MDAKMKLTQFMDAVNRGIDAEIASAEAKTDEKVKALLLEAESKCQAQSERDLAAAKTRITAKYQKRMSQVGYQGKTALLSRRQMLLMQLFADLKARLAAFTDSLEYLAWMTELLQKHAPEPGAVILLRSADLSMQEALAKAAGTDVTFRADASIQLGGLSVLSADGRRCENHTLDEAYAAQYRNFYRSHSLDGGEDA